MYQAVATLLEHGLHFQKVNTVTVVLLHELPMFVAKLPTTAYLCAVRVFLNAVFSL